MDLSPRPDPPRRPSLFRRGRRTSSPIRLGVADRPAPSQLLRAPSPPGARRPPSPLLPDDARAQQIVELEAQIQRLNVRLLESRQQLQQQDTRRSSLLRESRRLPPHPPPPSSFPSSPPAAAAASAAAATTTTNGRALDEPLTLGGVRLSSRRSSSRSRSISSSIDDYSFDEDGRLLRMGEMVLPRPHSPPPPPPQPSQPSREQPRSGPTGRVSLTGWRRRLSATEPLFFDRLTPTAARNGASWRPGGGGGGGAGSGSGSGSGAGSDSGGGAVDFNPDTWAAYPPRRVRFSTGDGDGLGDTAMGLGDELPLPPSERLRLLIDYGATEHPE